MTSYHQAVPEFSNDPEGAGQPYERRFSPGWPSRAEKVIPIHPIKTADDTLSDNVQRQQYHGRSLSGRLKLDSSKSYRSDERGYPLDYELPTYQTRGSLSREATHDEAPSASKHKDDR